MHIAHTTEVGGTKCLLFFLYWQKTKPKRLPSQRRIQIFYLFILLSNDTIYMVPRKRLELLHRKATASKTVVSTNSTTWAKMYNLFMVGREGFEPPKAKPKDLQSSPFDHSGTDP